MSQNHCKRFLTPALTKMAEFLSPISRWIFCISRLNSLHLNQPNPMKATRFLLLLFVLTIGISPVWAQTNPCTQKFGADSVNAIKNISVYREFFKQKNYASALESWLYVFANAPCAREQTHIDGVIMYKAFLAENSNPQRKEQIIDTILKIYDARILAFPKSAASTTARKGVDMLAIRPEPNAEVMNTFKKVLELGGNGVESYVLTNYFKTVLKEVAAGKIDKATAVDVYNQLNQVADFNIANTKDSTGKEAEKFAQAKQVLDADLAGNLVKDCQDIMQNFGTRYEANPSDKKLRDLVYGMLIGKGCTQEPIFLKVAENRLEETGEERLALLLARMYKQKEQMEKAMGFYQKAVEVAQNDSAKAQYCYEMAAIYSDQEQLAKARQMAQDAIKFRPDWGKPYIFIGDLYASSAGRCGEGIASQSVYWAAVDKYKKARDVDAACTEEATQRINKYSGYFPDKEALFFQSIALGSAYSVGCWIGEGTTVRARN